MWTAFSRRVNLPCILAFALAACGGAEVLVIPFFSFGFSGTTGATTVQLFFLPDSTTTSSGTNDVNMNFDATQRNYTGTYSGCDFKLTIAVAQNPPPAPAAATYDGRFTGPDDLQLVPTSGVGLPTIAMHRNLPATRDAGC